MAVGLEKKKRKKVTATEDLNQLDTAIEQMGKSIQEGIK